MWFNTSLKWYQNFIDPTFLGITSWAKLKLACYEILMH